LKNCNTSKINLGVLRQHVILLLCE
jgi:hypothetical protein